MTSVQNDRRDGVCACGHPFDAHELVEGFECSPGVTINGASSVPDVWVCSGGRLAAVTADLSPWNLACGCVLREAPPAFVRDREEGRG